MSVPKTYEKTKDELRTYEFDFTDQIEIVAGRTISSVNALTSSLAAQSTGETDSNPLVLGGPSLASPLVQFTISGGTDGLTYRINILVTLDDGTILEEDGYLTIYDRT